MITSIANKRMKNIILLMQKSRERKKQGLYVIEGMRLFKEAPPECIQEIYISEDLRQDRENYEQVTAKVFQCINIQNRVKVDVLTNVLFKKISDTQTPQGILCVLKMPQYEEEDLLSDENGLYMILEDIQDPGNLGTIFRTGEGAGITGVIMSGQTVDIFNPKAIRATMGSIYRVPFVYSEDLHESIYHMQKNGVRVFAAHLKGSSVYDENNYCRPTAFLIGNEGNGLKEETAALADGAIRIPMEGQVESLNASIAASLLMYECARQRRNDRSRA
ncbi:MAG: RNA methyltransferase [Lachnospiraceae bacterium]|nr:RNA methyltransferase [Lachnospiraceae bacterium]